ncbi:MAG TPA: glycosyltransferase, partial [Candidatus Dormibacteraeota bacterium]|nr:glycosyltransferase [Candidatus Dormibacteraeota bacterium]
MRIALVASQIAAIREPQVGGAQVVVADLARGLAERGHEVALFAPAGSAVDGVTVVDTGVDPAALAESRHRPLAENAPPPVVSDAFRRVFGAVAEGGWDCVHNHAFDAPAIDAARALRRPVVHTLHLPPERHVAAALALARSGDATAPLLVAVSDASARSWQERVPVDAIVRNGVPTRRIPWSAKGGPALLFAGRLSPEKGADIAIEIARRTETPLTIVGAAYDAAWAQQLVDGVDSRLVHVVGALPRTAVWTLMAGAAAL